LSNDETEERNRVMSVAIDALSAEEIHQEKKRFPRVFSRPFHERAIRWLAGIAVLALLYYTLDRFGFFSDKFWGSFDKLAFMLDHMFPPTHGGQFWEYVNAILETLSMALIGSLIGAIAALPLAFMAAKNFNPIRPLQFSTRRFADVLRAADYMIWGLIFVRAMGLGPIPGIMAIAIIDTGILVILYSEAIENIDRKQIEGVKASGGNNLEVIRFGVMPQVLPVLLTNALYMFESNTRAATILGIVGAGGIGFLLSDNLRAFEFSNALTIIIMIIIVVYGIDYMSRVLRMRYIKGDDYLQGDETKKSFASRLISKMQKSTS
jgi:phosphonate transport system permease protein